MNLALTEDQRMIRDSAAEFLAEASDGAAVRAAAASPQGHDAKLWAHIAELGWCGTAVPEAFDGMGLGPFELVLILEQMGRHLACAPFFATTALAANLLVHAGSKAAKQHYLPRLALAQLRATAAYDAAGVAAKKAKGGWTLTGKVPALVDGASAELLLFATRAGVFAVATGARGLKATARETWDATRRCADIELKNVAAERVDDPGNKRGLTRARALAQLYLAAEQLGGAQQCLDITARYDLERRQFGRPIASFQAVKHRLALMMVRVEGLRSMVSGAAATQDPLECAGARALAAETFFHCAAEAIQLHGGVGFTWEFEPHLHFKRAQAGSHLLGTASALREQIAQALL